MKDLKFNSETSYGSFLVDNDWYEKQENKDGLVLYEKAQEDPESKMLLICVFDKSISTNSKTKEKK
jgi:hypothetical protein